MAYGATIEAAIQMGAYAEDVVLLDVCAFSLGIAIFNKEDKNKDLMSKCIMKGTKLPFKKTRIYCTTYDNQTSILIQVFEGENKYVKDNYPLGTFELTNLPSKKAGEVKIEVTFELDENSILTVTGIEKDNLSNNNYIVIKNDKGGLSKNEIEKAKIEQENETFGNDLDPAISIERNYKNEINQLVNKINNITDPNEKYYSLQQLQKCIEGFIETFNKDISDNYTYMQKMHYYLNLLFISFSCSLNFTNLLSEEDKKNIINKVKNYLEIFKKSGTSYGASLIKIFKDNDDGVFLEFCLQILGYYSQRGTEYYINNDKKISKHYLEEALSLAKKYSLEERVKNYFNYRDSFNGILGNCKELLNILKAESIEKYCKSFSKDVLIKEDEFKTEEEKIDILDRFKDALTYVKEPKKKEDKLLKGMYLANIVKIEYKFFNSNNYDILLKMINESINLKIQAPYGCETLDLGWFDEICKIKLEIEEKQKNEKENPKSEEIKLKNDLKEIIDEIEKKSKEGKIKFFYYILTNHKPIGLDDNFTFQSLNQLENAYKSDEKRFMKKLRRFYNPVRYKGDKEEELKIHSIMQEISMKLNDID